MNRGGNQQQAQKNEQDQKFPATIDIIFDQRSQIEIIKDETLNKYQKNAYLLGKIFSVNSSDAATASQSYGADSNMSDDSSVISDQDDTSNYCNQDDFTLGQLLNALARNQGSQAHQDGIDPTFFAILSYQCQ